MTSALKVSVLVSVASVAMGFSASSGTSGAPTFTPVPEQFDRRGQAHLAAASIGTATMEADGAIVLRLIAEGPGGLRGEGILRYPPSDPHYREILNHIGPLKPGETRSVSPWPD